MIIIGIIKQKVLNIIVKEIETKREETARHPWRAAGVSNFYIA